MAVSRQRVAYVCSECGANFHRWSGRCPNCQQWDALQEETVEVGERRGGRLRAEPVAVSLADVDEADQLRLSSGMGELDRVLGGGLLQGSTVLLGGEPGIGKSTILLQAMGHMAAQGAKCLYVTCEESLGQFKLRARRLGHADSGLMVSGESSLEQVAALLSEHSPAAAVIDSIQMVKADGVDSPQGSLLQLRTCGGELARLAKEQKSALFLVGHITKSGAIAGPKVLEHVVDTVLYFESEKSQDLRILRAVKNRFGFAGEIGVFQMGSAGLLEVSNPSELFLAERKGAAPGSVVTSTIEGSRALLVEVQALVGPSAYGTPERKASGADYRRFSMMLSVLERRLGLSVGSCDAFVNVAGGVRVSEPAADLPMALAVASSLKERALSADAVVVGEVGLGGEVRAVSRIAERLKEAKKLGFSRAIIPRNNRAGAEEVSMNLTPVENLSQAVALLQ